jgi:hypothetical protein
MFSGMVHVLRVPLSSLFCPVQLLTDVKHHTTSGHMGWVGMGRGDGKLRDMPVDDDATDLLAVVLAESQRPIQPWCDIGPRTGCQEGVFSNMAAGSDALDLANDLGEPARAIAPDVILAGSEPGADSSDTVILAPEVI